MCGLVQVQSRYGVDLPLSRARCVVDMIAPLLTIGLARSELATMVWPMRNQIRSVGAFWYAGPGFLAVAVCRRTRDEPVLSSCASVSDLSAGGESRFCAGVLEAAVAAGTESLPHVVGLASQFCRIAPAEDGEDGVAVSGMDARAFADLEAVERIEQLFAAAALNLAAVDCEDCALMTLAEALGLSCAAAASTDPLAAVSVSSSCEALAVEYGTRLCIPIGLALARLTPCRHRA